MGCMPALESDVLAYQSTAAARPKVVQEGGAQVEDDAPDLLKRARGDVAGLGQVAAQVASLATIEREGLFQCVQAHDQAGEGLAHLVVELAGDAPSFLLLDLDLAGQELAADAGTGVGLLVKVRVLQGQGGNGGQQVQQAHGLAAEGGPVVAAEVHHPHYLPPHAHGDGERLPQVSGGWRLQMYPFLLVQAGDHDRLSVLRRQLEQPGPQALAAQLGATPRERAAVGQAGELTGLRVA